MSSDPTLPDRREFLRRLAAGAAYAAPLFATVGALMAESSALERARGYLDAAKKLVTRARGASSDDERHALAAEASTELTEARKVARGATAGERERFEKDCEAVARDIKKLQSGDRR